MHSSWLNAWVGIFKIYIYLVCVCFLARKNDLHWSHAWKLQSVIFEVVTISNQRKSFPSWHVGSRMCCGFAFYSSCILVRASSMWIGILIAQVNSFFCIFWKIRFVSHWSTHSWTCVSFWLLTRRKEWTIDALYRLFLLFFRLLWQLSLHVHICVCDHMQTYASSFLHTQMIYIFLLVYGLHVHAHFHTCVWFTCTCAFSYLCMVYMYMRIFILVYGLHVHAHFHTCVWFTCTCAYRNTNFSSSCTYIRTGA